MAITPTEVRDLVSKITYKDGWFILCGVDGDRMYVQVQVIGGTCSVTRAKTDWKGGKKYLSPYMCKQEIVGACLAIIKAAEEHEMLEWFRYDGASIFNPHLDPDLLAELARKKSSFVTRPDSQSMTQAEPKLSAREQRAISEDMDALYGMKR